jgi:hypothetical protein
VGGGGGGRVFFATVLSTDYCFNIVQVWAHLVFRALAINITF